MNSRCLAAASCVSAAGLVHRLFDLEIQQLVPALLHAGMLDNAQQLTRIELSRVVCALGQPQVERYGEQFGQRRFVRAVEFVAQFLPGIRLAARLGRRTQIASGPARVGFDQLELLDTGQYAEFAWRLLVPGEQDKVHVMRDRPGELLEGLFAG